MHEYTLVEKCQQIIILDLKVISWYILVPKFLNCTNKNWVVPNSGILVNFLALKAYVI